MSQFVVENMLLSKIHVGARRREKVGSLSTLKASLERVGQIHPITVRPNSDGFELVAGERRLLSAQALGWKKIRARVGKFTDEQLREIEIDENAVRLDLTDFEASKAKLRQIEAAEREAREGVSAQLAPKANGRPKGGDREAARRTGLSRDEVRRTKKHVAAAAQFPVFEGKDWKRSQVFAATEALETLPQRAQASALEMATAPNIDPKSAVVMLENLSTKPAPERDSILKLYRSDDAEQRSLAMTRAAALPPMPDKRLLLVDEIERLLKRCIKLKDDDLQSAIKRVLADVEKISAELDRAYEKLKEGNCK